MVTQNVVLMQGQQELLNEAGEEGIAKEFCHFQWHLALGPHFKPHLSVQTEETKVFLEVCNIGIFNEMVLRYSRYILPCNTKRTSLLVVTLGKHFKSLKEFT